ncbi:unnamed protein product [Malus baccata var. baccata]
MASAHSVRIFACIPWLLFLSLPFSSSVEPSIELSLVISESDRLQLSHGVPVKKFPGSKPGILVLFSRLKNIGKFANTVKVKVSGTNSSTRIPTFEVCVHRRNSLSCDMIIPLSLKYVLYCCKVISVWNDLFFLSLQKYISWDWDVPSQLLAEGSQGLWSRSMSPFEHQLIDVRTYGSSLESLEVSIEEGTTPDSLSVFFVLQNLLNIMMSLASHLSKSLVFYYGSGMANWGSPCNIDGTFSGNGMKLLPTGRKNSLAIFVYSSVVGMGSFLLGYLPGLLRTLLTEIGISEDMYNPLAIFLLAFVFLAGAWLGIWAVHKLFLAEDGSIEIMTSQFVNWSIKILGATFTIKISIVVIIYMRKKRNLRLNFHVLHNLVYKYIQSLFSRETTTKALQELASSPEYHRWCSSNFLISRSTGDSFGCSKQTANNMPFAKSIWAWYTQEKAAFSLGSRG